MRTVIPVSSPVFSGNEKKYLIECIDSGWISGEGPFIGEFEKKFAEYVGRAFGISVSSGSGALDVAIGALELSKGDEVIMPTFTIISPALSVVRAGAIPVLVDSDPSTWNMDTSLIRSRITPRTKAILVVHIYGLPVDMDPIIDICKEYDLKLIEDAAEMHGQMYKGKRCGSFGQISTFSFYLNKNVTTGEGGMIMTDDPELAARCKKLRNLAFEPHGRRFLHHEAGWNYRMTNMQAALGLAQLETLDTHITAKRNIGKQYAEGLKDLQGFKLPLMETSYAKNIFWVFGLVADTEEKCIEATTMLTSRNIGTRPFFWCMHEQPVFQKLGLFAGEKHPHAELLARNGFYLPNGVGLTSEEINSVLEAMKQIAP